MVEIQPNDFKNGLKLSLQVMAGLLGGILNPNIALLSGNNDGRDGIDVNKVGKNQYYYGNQEQIRGRN